MKRLILIGIVALSAPLAIAQTPAHTEHSPMSDCPMMKQHEGMKEKDSATDAKLKSLLADMNRSTGAARIDAMAAIINTLVSERSMGCAMQPASMKGASGHGPMADCPMMKEKDSSGVPGTHAESHHDHAAMQAHGSGMMGFEQSKTTHHFFLYNDGGAIELAVNDPADKTDLEAIRIHLQHIATMFGSGDFSAPAGVHGHEVPGTATMAKRKDRITYVYSETATGGRVTITTTDAEALEAVHVFLKFQITNHKTGDSLQPKAHK